MNAVPKFDMAAGEPDAGPARPIHVTEVLVAESALGSVPAEWDADQSLTAMYSTHYRSLVRLAALLVRDVATAEEVVQESFITMHTAWRRIRDNDKALSYLRQSVVNRSRSVLRHRVVVDRNAPKPVPDMPSAEQGALTLLERSEVVTALRALPPRQAPLMLTECVDLARLIGIRLELRLTSARAAVIARGGTRAAFVGLLSSTVAVLAGLFTPPRRRGAAHRSGGGSTLGWLRPV